MDPMAWSAYHFYNLLLALPSYLRFSIGEQGTTCVVAVSTLPKRRAPLSSAERHWNLLSGRGGDWLSPPRRFNPKAALLVTSFLPILGIGGSCSPLCGEGA